MEPTRTATREALRLFSTGTVTLAPGTPRMFFVIKENP